MLINMHAGIHADLGADLRKPLLEIMRDIEIEVNNNIFQSKTVGGIPVIITSLSYTHTYGPQKIFSDLLGDVAIPTTHGMENTGYFGTAIIARKPFKVENNIGIVFVNDPLNSVTYGAVTNKPVAYKKAIRFSIIFYDFIDKCYVASPGTYIKDRFGQMKRLTLPMPLQRREV